MDYIRIWTEMDIKEIEEHILMVDDLLGFCPGCKKIGIGLSSLEKCRTPSGIIKILLLNVAGL